MCLLWEAFDNTQKHTDQTEQFHEIDSSRNDHHLTRTEAGDTLYEPDFIWRYLKRKSIYTTQKNFYGV